MHSGMMESFSAAAGPGPADAGPEPAASYSEDCAPCLRLRVVFASYSEDYERS